MKVGIVIAAYNEGKTIQGVLKGLPKHLPGVTEIVPIVVDDGSGDSTSEAARSVAGVAVLRHVINRGQGAALHTGFQYALHQGCEIIVSFDADGQHAASEIAEIIKPVQSGLVDVALGSRFLSKEAKNMPISRRFTLKAGVLFTRLLSRIKVSDTHNGFRAFSREALEQMSLHHDRMEHASEILDEISHRQLRYVEVPVTISYTDYSKMKGQRSSAAVKMALKLILHKLAK